MANNDLILLLDDQDICLVDDSNTDLILEDSLPHSQHYYDYDGEYYIIPRLRDFVVLPSENRLMKQDVFIEPITFTREDNEFGGVTVTIGID